MLVKCLSEPSRLGAGRLTGGSNVPDNLIICAQEVGNLEAFKLTANGRRQIILRVLVEGSRVLDGSGSPRPCNVIPANNVGLGLWGLDDCGHGQPRLQAAQGV